MLRRQRAGGVGIGSRDGKQVRESPKIAVARAVHHRRNQP